MIIIIVGTYAISSTFFSVYSMAVDTIFLCFLEDLDKHDGSPDNPYFMNDDLMRILEIKENKTDDDWKEILNEVKCQNTKSRVELENLMLIFLHI